MYLVYLRIEAFMPSFQVILPYTATMLGAQTTIVLSYPECMLLPSAGVVRAIDIV